MYSFLAERCFKPLSQLSNRGRCRIPTYGTCYCSELFKSSAIVHSANLPNVSPVGFKPTTTFVDQIRILGGHSVTLYGTHLGYESNIRFPDLESGYTSSYATETFIITPYIVYSFPIPYSLLHHSLVHHRDTSFYETYVKLLSAAFTLLTSVIIVG